MGNFRAFEEDAPGGWLEEFRQYAKACGLACSIRADQSVNTSGTYLQTDVIDSRKAVELLRETFRPQNVFV